MKDNIESKKNICVKTNEGGYCDSPRASFIKLFSVGRGIFSDFEGTFFSICEMGEGEGTCLQCLLLLRP